MNSDPLKGEIWLVNLEPAREGELGKAKRPCLVFQNNSARVFINTITLIPFSSEIKQYNSIHILLNPTKSNGLSKPSSAICSHIYTTTRNRLIKKIGVLSESELKEITDAVLLHLDIDIL